jgi:drug/metabolite transporter (DMT)-like permease
MSSSPSAHRKGIFYIVAALATLICLDAAGKYAVQKVPVAATVWSRYVGHMIVVFLFAFPALKTALWKTQNLPLQCLRGLLLALMTWCYFNAFRTLPLAHGTAILFLTPILITIWAKVFLHENVTARQWFAVCVGFAGVLIICRPSSGLNVEGVWYALAAALCNSFYQTLTRKFSGQDRPEVQLFFTGLVGAAAMSASLPMWWQPFSVELAHGLAFVVLGVAGALGHWLLVKAYEAAPASVLAPWMYLQLVFSLALGWIIFRDVPDAIALIGMIIVVIAPRLARGRV